MQGEYTANPGTLSSSTTAPEFQARAAGAPTRDFRSCATAYLDLFSAAWPYRMYRCGARKGPGGRLCCVGCEGSPCGGFLATGSAYGWVLMWSFYTASHQCTM
ncbi:WD repeat-containing protein 25 [Fukomys damarensis]|uniref:WD repeat-containing protein 25 n=1 Tax=Fukomys damarensis TaxID=885580 RepID=A0A091CUE0_FUKDA|nr:WD repeat-containing protein 25 [Fukomys damarensis]